MCFNQLPNHKLSFFSEKCYALILLTSSYSDILSGVDKGIQRVPTHVRWSQTQPHQVGRTKQNTQTARTRAATTTRAATQNLGEDRLAWITDQTQQATRQHTN